MKKTYDLSSSRVMVTGGCGFIGSHLVKGLLKKGVESITVIDNMKCGNHANLERISDRVKVIKYNLGTENLEELARYLKRVDYLFHLAAEKHNQSLNRPNPLLISNVNGTFNLANLAAQNGVRKVVYSSSLYVYGRRNKPKYVEKEIPLPNTVYGISKLAGEHFFIHTHKQYGLDYVVLRYLFVYGPCQFSGMGYKSVIVKNFERILSGKSPIVLGDGEQTLDYIYVGDVVEANISAMESEYDSEIFNVSSSKGITINELVDKMLQVAGSPLTKAYGPPDETHGSYRVGDNSKIGNCLGFKPSTSLEDGLKETFEWMKEKK